MTKPCKICGSLYHSQTFCPRKNRAIPRKARKPIARESAKTRAKRQQTATAWFKLNPPDATEHWTCYLQISSMCPKRLTRSMVYLEHVRPRSRHPELKFNVKNIRPACYWCNELKGSRELEELVKIWPHLVIHLKGNRSNNSFSAT